jgi:hypothetical protein
MTAALPIEFESPRLGLAALGMLVAIVALLWRNRVLGRRPAWLIGVGAAALAVAAGSPVWSRPVVGTVAVMVDLSPSTRGATFRNRSALDERIARLMGRTPFRICAFSDRLRPLPPGAVLPDYLCDQTVLTPPPCDAVVLFSDGRFDPPAGLPPVYPVIDPALDDPADSAVTRLDATSELARAAVLIMRGARRAGGGAGPPATADPLTAVPTGAEVRYTLTPGDLWPENDSLAIRTPTPEKALRWWVGGAAPAGWIAVSPARLPTDPADYLGPAVIVLNDIPATDLSIAQQAALGRYVRDFGGGLVIVGGAHAFGAGAYDRTELDRLSPLASAPPDPAARWVILIDGSGSMSEGVPGGATAWQTESAAARAIVAALPASDAVTVGSFAAMITTWVTDVPAGRIDPARLPPPGLGPRGPTNLQAALESFTAVSSPLATRVLLMTDADARLVDADRLAAALAVKHVSLSVLATGDGPALGALRAIVAATGGAVVEQPDPTRWVSAAEALARGARPDGLRQQPLAVRLVAPLAGTVTVSEWNPTWLRDKIDLLATAPGRPMAAVWHAGLGRVAAVAWKADPGTAAAIAATVAAPPADPRFHVTVDPGRTLRIAVDAVDGTSYLNDQPLMVAIGDGPAVAIPQVSPGLYELNVPAPRDPAVVTVLLAGRPINRVAVAGRYPPEFDGIGNERAAMQALAVRTGGRVISPGPVSPIDFHWPRSAVSLFTPFAVGGLIIIGVGLLLWRRALR